MGFSGASDGKESACNAGDQGFNSSAEEIPRRREWLPTPVFFPGEFHGQRSLASYSPWDCKDSDMTEWITHKVPVGESISYKHLPGPEWEANLWRYQLVLSQERTFLSYFLFFPPPSLTMAWSKTTAWWAWIQESYHKLLFLLSKYPSLPSAGLNILLWIKTKKKIVFYTGLFKNFCHKIMSHLLK